MTNLNKMAQNITLQEGGRVSLPISQVKEVIKLTLRTLKTLSVTELIALLARIK